MEHTFPNGAGAFDATATQGDDDAWVMQGVGFRQPAGAIPGFTVDASALSPVSVAPGGSATSTITVTATDGFTGSVALTCPTTGLPTGVTCLFATNPVIVGASPATSLLTISTTAGTPAGSTPIAITGTSGSVVSSAPVTLVVVAAGSGNFTLTATPTSQTVSAGASGTSTITINPTGGFTGTVSLTCSVAPTASPAPVCSLPASATTTATLTVSTTAATAAVRHSSNIFYAMLLPIGGMTLLGVGFGSRRKKVLGVLLVFLMVSGLLFLAACGGGSSSGGGGGGGTVRDSGWKLHSHGHRHVGKSDSTDHNIHFNRPITGKKLMPAARQASAINEVFRTVRTSRGFHLNLDLPPGLFSP